MSIGPNRQNKPLGDQHIVWSAGYHAWRQQQKRMALWVWIIRGTLLAGILVLWQVAADAQWVNPLLISSPLAVASTAVHLWSSGGLMPDFFLTFQETILSVVISLALGMGGAVVIWWNPLLERITDPFLTVLNALPKIALGPIFFIWLGDHLSIYGMAISISVIVTLLMLSGGFRQTEVAHTTLMRSLGAGKRHILMMVVIPDNIPNLVATIKVNLSLNMVGVIAGEFLASKAGLGYLILYGSQVFQMSQVMVGIVALGIMAAILYASVSWVGQRLMRRYHFV